MAPSNCRSQYSGAKRQLGASLRWASSPDMRAPSQCRLVSNALSDSALCQMRLAPAHHKRAPDNVALSEKELLRWATLPRRANVAVYVALYQKELTAPFAFLTCISARVLVISASRRKLGTIKLGSKKTCFCESCTLVKPGGFVESGIILK